MQETPSETLGRRRGVAGWSGGALAGGLPRTSPRRSHRPPHPQLKLFSDHQRAPRLHANVLIHCGLLQGRRAAFISQVLACSPQPPCSLPAKTLQTHLPAPGPALSTLYIPAALGVLVPPTCPEALGPRSQGETPDPGQCPWRQGTIHVAPSPGALSPPPLCRKGN